MHFTTLAAVFLAPFLVSAAPTMRKRASDADKTVLKFAELLEQLETKFYQEALLKFKDDDFKLAGITIPKVATQNFQAIAEHELAHTQFLDAALEAVGDKPITGCKFNFDSVLTDVKTMATVARVVEAAGVGAYLGGSVLIDDKNILVAAASILTIEARHQTFLNILNGASGIPQPFDIALTPPQVLALAGGFIQDCDVEGALGIPANPPLSITNTDPVAPGTLLTFDSPALASAGDKELSCQMLFGGNANASSFPIKECIVPSGINGPVAIFITTDPQPLSASVVVQVQEVILAGPTIAFIDSVPDALGALARSGKSVESSEQITPDQAKDALDKASTVTTETGTATDSPSEPTATPSSSSAAGAPVEVIGVTSIPA